MKYVIAHLVRGEAKEYHIQLTRDLTEKFDTFPIYDRVPPHLTLKRSFELTDEGMELLHTKLSTFARSHTKSDYSMTQFNSFGEDVLFLDVDPSEKMEQDVRALMDVLHTHPALKFDEYDNGSDFHATVALQALKSFDYKTINEYLQNIEQPHFTVMFDNIALLKKVETTWVTDTVFELGNQ